MKRLLAMVLLGGVLGSAGWVGLKQRERLEDLAAERDKLEARLEKRSESETGEQMDEPHRIAAAAVELQGLARRARQMMEAGEDGRIAGLFATARPAFRGIGFEDARRILGEGDEMRLGCLLQVLDAGEAVKLMLVLRDQARSGSLVHPFRRWIQSDPREALEWYEAQPEAGAGDLPDSERRKMEEEALMGEARIDPAGAVERLRRISVEHGTTPLRNLGVKVGISLTRNGERGDLLECLARPADDETRLAREGVVDGMPSLK